MTSDRSSTAPRRGRSRRVEMEHRGRAFAVQLSQQLHHLFDGQLVDDVPAAPLGAP